MPRGGARNKPTITAEKIDRVVSYVRAGNYMETAAAASGIGKTALYEWLKRGRKERDRVAKDPKLRVRKSEALFVTFSEKMEEATAQAETRDVLLIAQAAKEDWKAAAWRLERKYPGKYGRVARQSGAQTRTERLRAKYLKAQIEKTKAESARLNREENQAAPDHVTIIDDVPLPEADPLDGGDA